MNKLISEFEAIEEIQRAIRTQQLIFNTKLGCYTKKSGKMCVSANWTNGAWFVFERKAKAQAVPEGYCLVPREPTDKMLKRGNRLALSDSQYRYDASSIYEVMLEASESGAEG